MTVPISVTLRPTRPPRRPPSVETWRAIRLEQRPAMMAATGRSKETGDHSREPATSGSMTDPLAETLIAWPKVAPPGLQSFTRSPPAWSSPAGGRGRGARLLGARLSGAGKASGSPPVACAQGAVRPHGALASAGLRWLPDPWTGLDAVSLSDGPADQTSEQHLALLVDHPNRPSLAVRCPSSVPKQRISGGGPGWPAHSPWGSARRRRPPPGGGFSETWRRVSSDCDARERRRTGPGQSRATVKARCIMSRSASVNCSGRMS
jgi:hypothetical protein